MSKSNSKDLERRREIVARFKLVDDTFFELVMQDKEVCEEVLRVILEDEKLKVLEVIPQKSIKNLHGRAVRLDAHCILGNGEFCNIEIQKENVDNQLKRCRYNASCITANITEPGDKFENVPDVYIVYISRFDMFKRGKTIYHAGMCVKETGEFLEDGLHEVYVNTKIDDGSDIARLMKCFEQETVQDEKFPKLSARVMQFKAEEEEVHEVCSLVEDYAKDYAKEYVKDKAKNMIRDGLSDEKIAQYLDLTVEEVKELRNKEGKD